MFKVKHRREIVRNFIQIQKDTFYHTINSEF